MKVREIAEHYRVRPQVVYTILRDFESTGRVKIDRAGRHLRLDPSVIETVSNELERRGYEWGER